MLIYYSPRLKEHELLSLEWPTTSWKQKYWFGWDAGFCRYSGN